MLWFQGTNWEDLLVSDFLTIIPIKHFNDLEEVVKLPVDHYPYMIQKSSEILSMWMDCKNWKYKPSDFREDNRILQEDLRAFQMLDIMQRDAEKYLEAKQKVEQKNREYIQSEQAKFRASKGRRR